MLFPQVPLLMDGINIFANTLLLFYPQQAVDIRLRM